MFFILQIFNNNLQKIITVGKKMNSIITYIQPKCLQMHHCSKDRLQLLCTYIYTYMLAACLIRKSHDCLTM